MALQSYECPTHHSALSQRFKCQHPNVLHLWVYGKGLAGKTVLLKRWLDCGGVTEMLFLIVREDSDYPTLENNQVFLLSSFWVDNHPLKQKFLLSVLKWISFLCGVTFSHTISITPVCKVFLFFQYNCLTLLHLRMPPNFTGSANFASMLQILTRTLCKMRPKDQLLSNCLPCFLPAWYCLPSHCLQPVSCSLQFS